MDGQMSIFDFPEYLPENPAAIENDMCCELDPEAPDYLKAGNCKYCAWWNRLVNPYIGTRSVGCFWQQESPEHLDAEELKTHSCWMPETTGMKVCASCKHSNSFLNFGEDAHNPEITNDLYCDLSTFGGKHPENRRELFQEYRVKNEFGLGFYSRNHEYDTCDCWEPMH